MLNRLLLILGLIGTTLAAPWITELILTVGKPATLAILAPIGFALGAGGVGTLLERN
jgi:hypothetical protein